MRAIVLERRDIREHDQMVTFLTKERGKQEVMARGIKKITSKHAAHIEPSTVIDVEIVHGKKMDHLIKVIPIDSRISIRTNPHKSILTLYGIRIVNLLTEAGQLDEGVYDILDEYIGVLDSIEKTRLIVLDAFVLQLFSLLGMQPVITHCVVCSKKSQLFGFYFLGGGVICSGCRKEKEKLGHSITPCGKGARKTLRFLLGSDFETVSRLHLSAVQYRILHKIIYGFARHHHDRNIPDWVGKAF